MGRAVLVSRCGGYLGEELSQADVETHQVSRVRGDDIHVLAADIFRCRAHCRFHGFSSCVHEEFGEPFEDELDLLGIGFLEVCGRERDTDVADASCDFSIWLEYPSDAPTSQCHCLRGQLTRRMNASLSSSFFLLLPLLLLLLFGLRNCWLIRAIESILDVSRCTLISGCGL